VVSSYHRDIGSCVDFSFSFSFVSSTIMVTSNFNDDEQFICAVPTSPKNRATSRFYLLNLLNSYYTSFANYTFSKMINLIIFVASCTPCWTVFSPKWMLLQTEFVINDREWEIVHAFGCSVFILPFNHVRFASLCSSLFSDSIPKCHQSITKLAGKKVFLLRTSLLNSGQYNALSYKPHNSRPKNFRRLSRKFLQFFVRSFLYWLKKLQNFQTRLKNLYWFYEICLKK